MEPGQILLVPSDGIVEAKSPTGSIFGVEGILRVVEDYRGSCACELVEMVHREVWRFCQNAPPLDDMTLVVAKVAELCSEVAI
jgi:sigma-B regulation protein RsbU (phosphoserine phosphatase)